MKSLKLQTIPALVEDVTKLQNELDRLREFVAEKKANIAVMSGFQKEVAAVKAAVAES